MDINYTSNNFLQSALYSLRQGDALTILVAPGWRSRFLLKELGRLPVNSMEAELAGVLSKRFPSFKLFVFMSPFTIAHFFALSGGYEMRFERWGDGVKVTYLPVQEETGPHHE